MNFSSKILEEAVSEFASLPGVGQKTALRYILYLLKQDPVHLQRFSRVLARLREELRHCTQCFSLSDQEVCGICSQPSRNRSCLCVVENIQDVMAIENTGQFRGLYHVLGGVISPMDGLGPSDLTLDPLIERVKKGEIRELILALSTTMEGDTTNFYIYKKVKDSGIAVSMIARGIAIGDELGYTDEITLGKSILNRMPYENSLPAR